MKIAAVQLSSNVRLHAYFCALAKFVRLLSRSALLKFFPALSLMRAKKLRAKKELLPPILKDRFAANIQAVLDAFLPKSASLVPLSSFLIIRQRTFIASSYTQYIA